MTDRLRIAAKARDPRAMTQNPRGQRPYREEAWNANWIRECASYLQTQARQEMDRDVAVVYVLVPAGTPRSIAGCYSLSSTAVRHADLPETTRRRLPRYPLVPATRLGRLAVDQAGFQLSWFCGGT